MYWDQDAGFRAIMAEADTFTEISPFWYHVDEGGAVRAYSTQAGCTYEDAAILLFLRAHDILTIPTVANIRDGQWDGGMVSRILQDPQLTAAHIGALVALTVTRGYDGIDIDYEDLAAADRGNFTGFIQQLANALHANGKLLAVDVYGKTAEPGTWSGPMAQDWAALGAAADELRLMTYEYHWSTSEPGPIAPAPWVRNVLAFATSVVPPGKIVHGLPLYGYDWIDRSATAQVWDAMMATARQQGSPLQWDPLSASPWYEYTSGRDHHVVWFENAMSVESKLGLADAAGVGGVMLWRLGGEDAAVWPAIRAFATSSPLPPSY